MHCCLENIIIIVHHVQNYYFVDNEGQYNLKSMNYFLFLQETDEFKAIERLNLIQMFPTYSII